MGVSIILEGPEGAGKTLQASLLELMFTETEFPTKMAREPGGTMVSEMIRNMILNSRYAKDIEPLTQLFLFSASRSEVQAAINSFFEENPNGIYIRDRGWPSSLAHQFADGVNYEYLREVQAPFINFRDTIYLIDLPEEESLVRVAIKKKLGPHLFNWRDELDPVRYEIVRNQYLRMALEFPKRFIVLDGFKDPWELTKEIGRGVVTRLTEDERTVEGAETLLLNYEIFFGAFREKYNERVNLEELASIEAEVRQELGVPGREILREKMYDSWVKWGIVEGYQRDRERR